MATLTKMSVELLNVSSPIPNDPNYHPSVCNLQTCPLIYAYLMYDPTLWGNALFLSIFSLLLPIQAFLSIHYRTSGVLVATFLGLSMEIIGYVGRVRMHFNPFLKENFLMYLIPLTIGPVFLAAAVYLCLARIVVVYGEHLSLMRPRSYTLLFCCCDFFSLVLQAIGGAMAAMAETRPQVSLVLLSYFRFPARGRDWKRER
jgi:RTA1 like protein